MELDLDEEAARGASHPDTPKATTTKAPVGRYEAEDGTPKVASSGVTPAASGAGDRALGFGQLRLNFDVLRKRKGSPSCSGDAFRPLKLRKYIAIDE